jgi:hypothetical protein
LFHNEFPRDKEKDPRKILHVLSSDPRQYLLRLVFIPQIHEQGVHWQQCLPGRVSATKTRAPFTSMKCSVSSWCRQVGELNCLKRIQRDSCKREKATIFEIGVVANRGRYGKRNGNPVPPNQSPVEPLSLNFAFSEPLSFLPDDRAFNRAVIVSLLPPRGVTFNRALGVVSVFRTPYTGVQGS